MTMKRGDLVFVEDDNGIATKVRVGVDVAIEWAADKDGMGYRQAQHDPRGVENDLSMRLEGGLWVLRAGDMVQTFGALNMAAQAAQDWRNSDLHEVAGFSGRFESAIGGGR